MRRWLAVVVAACALASCAAPGAGGRAAAHAGPWLVRGAEEVPARSSPDDPTPRGAAAAAERWWRTSVRFDETADPAPLAQLASRDGCLDCAVHVADVVDHADLGQRRAGLVVRVRDVVAPPVRAGRVTVSSQQRWQPSRVVDGMGATLFEVPASSWGACSVDLVWEDDAWKVEGARCDAS